MQTADNINTEQRSEVEETMSNFQNGSTYFTVTQEVGYSPVYF